MNKEIPQFPDYGDGGDLSGAHRSRKAFRLCVLAIVILTGSMWIAENYMHYGHTESLYRNAITLKRPSARVLLYSAVKADAENLDKPTAKYTQALAVREEDDKILRLYDEAQSIDDTNAMFTLRHGSRLFVLGYPEEALAKYQRAENLLESPKTNLLPGYLQAAAIAQQRDDPGAIAEALVLAARTNNREGSIVFPKPFWFPTYPRNGTQYAMLQREIIDENCAPLYALASLTSRAVSKKIGQEQYQEARTWIAHLNRMGERLVESSEPSGTLQALAGISIQMQCVELTEKLEVAQTGSVGEATINNRVRLTRARDAIIEFESTRDEKVAAQERLIRRPFLLAFGTFFLFSAIWFAAWCMYRIFHLPKSVWTLQHGLFGRITLGGACVAYVILLLLLNAISVLTTDTQSLVTVFSWVWYAATGLFLLLGLIYPATMLTSPDEASRKFGPLEDVETVSHYARIAYRKVYLSLTLRYYGMLVGLYTICICGWIIGYFMLNGLFPWQVNLIGEGYLGDEAALVTEVVRGLKGDA